MASVYIGMRGTLPELIGEYDSIEEAVEAVIEMLEETGEIRTECKKEFHKNHILDLNSGVYADPEWSPYPGNSTSVWYVQVEE